MTQKQKKLLWRILAAAVLFVPLYLISEGIVHWAVPRWALLLLFLTYLGLVIRYRLKRRAYQRRLADARQIRIDMEESEEEGRYERRKPRTAARQELVMEPDSYRRDEDGEKVDEPTRVSGDLPAVTEEVDEPTKEQPPTPQTEEESEQVKDYFEEFFSEK